MNNLAVTNVESLELRSVEQDIQSLKDEELAHFWCRLDGNEQMSRWLKALLSFETVQGSERGKRNVQKVLEVINAQNPNSFGEKSLYSYAQCYRLFPRFAEDSKYTDFFSTLRFGHFLAIASHRTARNDPNGWLRMCQDNMWSTVDLARHLSEQGGNHNEVKQIEHKELFTERAQQFYDKIQAEILHDAPQSEVIEFALEQLARKGEIGYYIAESEIEGCASKMLEWFEGAKDEREALIMGIKAECRNVTALLEERLMGKI